MAQAQKQVTREGVSYEIIESNFKQGKKFLGLIPYKKSESETLLIVDHRWKMHVSQYDESGEDMINDWSTGPSYDGDEGQWVLTIDPGEIIVFSQHGQNVGSFRVVQSGETLALEEMVVNA